MACADELFHDCRADETCGTSYKNTHIISSYAIFGSADRDEALIRLASRLQTFAVINRHSRAEAGRSLISINSCNQSSAESSACSDPNTWVMALKNAVNSCSAIATRAGQGGFKFFDGSY